MKSIRMHQNYDRSPQELLELLASEKFWKEHDCEFSREGGVDSGWHVRVACPVDKDQVPSQFAQFVSPNVRVTQVARVPAAKSDGGVVSYQAYAPGIPAKVEAHITVEGQECSSTVTVDATLGINVPFVGPALESKAEPTARKLLQRQLDKLAKL